MYPFFTADPAVHCDYVICCLSECLTRSKWCVVGLGFGGSFCLGPSPSPPKLLLSKYKLTLLVTYYYLCVGPPFSSFSPRLSSLKFLLSKVLNKHAE